ncbi:multicopper oxidase domain-containing protein [Paenibacillus chondroitinus]|uniref:Copper-containing nitrite reductase n=1 Tax=Paenibacillus chondroitinus TaxID=59842 RepID=A0ABU6DNK4_9BACL|nr:MULTISPECIES: multicopper oxidase domain-containing protein [Paenibacillus]MCY9657128.1 multicopper oxidase domain-containing protein [Paenibacillus anseongense]MEB4798411.1 multicopper oxidase domain-containing protein [Paenibacillus chondroitinus]
MNLWESRIRYPDGQIAPYQQGPNWRHFKLIAEPIKREIIEGLTIEALGYNGVTPGPLIIVEQGDWVILEVENRTDKPNALHIHGLAKPNFQDGMPAVEPTPTIQPGQSYTYRFQAWQVGSFFYHSSEIFQITRGLMGPFIVIPKQEQIPEWYIPYYDYVMVLQQWEIPQPELGKVELGTFQINKFDTDPNFFTFNGKSFPNTAPIYTSYGQKIRIRFINKSNTSHSMHTHGHDFKVVAVDGFPRNDWMDDTIDVASGRRFDVELLSNNPGIWVVNGTKTFHQSNNGIAPGGMISRLIYENYTPKSP